MKKIAIIIFLTVTLVAFAALYLFSGQETPPGEQTPGAYNGPDASIDLSKTPDYPYMDIQTSSGTVRVQDYYSIAKNINQYEVVLEQNDNFTITVFPEDNQFNIIVQGHPLDKYQLEAESRLLTLLKINESNLCKLKVKIGVLYSDDPRFAGLDFAPSFCPPYPR